MSEVAGVGRADVAGNDDLASRLREAVRGDVRFDALSRTIYATDASMYEIMPRGVVLPKGVNDVLATVQLCREYGTPMVPRGAGTGLAGGAVGPGVQIDLSRHMRHIGEVDVQARTVEVEPGVVLDALNAHLAPHGLHFAPDVATSSRATIGGMIANNSCGAHSIIYGRTVDHVTELSMVLADGDMVTFGRSDVASAVRLEHGLAGIRDDCYDEIQRRFPKVLRSNGGYGLDRLGPPGTLADATKIICGSEGTLGVVVGAKLKLTPLPKHRSLVVLHFPSVPEALGATPMVLRHHPAAVELVDRMIIEAGLSNPALGKRYRFLHGMPGALLIVEFQGDDATNLSVSTDKLTADSDLAGTFFAAPRLFDAAEQAGVWNLRTSGLGLLMSKPGDAQPHAFVEDSAVDPSRLREYIERFTKILHGEGVKAGYYAHASVGCIHVRPIINLKNGDDIQRVKRIADAVSDLALEFCGAMTGEHGDGIVRSCWLEKMYGPQITNAFRSVKQLFDPQNLFNPHKIVDPWPMTDHLRYGPSFESQSVKTHLDFSAHGGMAGLAGMCSGVGQCRQELVGTMCPSYMATKDETHTTRARANALRHALSNRGDLSGLNDPALAEVMDLCISCKACKTECPTGVDMAKLKTEYLSHKQLTNGVNPRARLIADMPIHLATASRFPRLSNWLVGSGWIRRYLQRRYGLDHRVPPPQLAHQTFRKWFRRHHIKPQARSGQPKRNAPRGRVVYFVDTWTNYFTPQVGIAAVALLEHAGYEVLCPRVQCCARPAISQGLLTEAKQNADFNVHRLAPLAMQGVPIVGTEPSCLLTLVDEYPQLVPTHAARRIAKQSVMVETLLARLVEEGQLELPSTPIDAPLLFHAHCHHKALLGSADTMTLLCARLGDAATEINSGCCGMAGSFGHEVEHYEIARQIGEQRLFPAVRNRGDAHIAVSGFSCRQQIEHHTAVHVRHIIEYLADGLG